MTHNVDCAPPRTAARMLDKVSLVHLTTLYVGMDAQLELTEWGCGHVSY